MHIAVSQYLSRNLKVKKYSFRFIDGALRQSIGWNAVKTNYPNIGDDEWYPGSESSEEGTGTLSPEASNTVNDELSWGSFQRVSDKHPKEKGSGNVNTGTWRRLNWQAMYARSQGRFNASRSSSSTDLPIKGTGKTSQCFPCGSVNHDFPVPPRQIKSRVVFSGHNHEQRSSSSNTTPSIPIANPLTVTYCDGRNGKIRNGSKCSSCNWSICFMCKDNHINNQCVNREPTRSQGS